VQIRYLDAVKGFEGFAQKSSWDYAQHTNGFGTKALYPGEEITLDEANRRFLAEIEEARRFVDTHAQGWDEGTKAALTSLTFNAGTRWASSGLGDAVRNFDIDAVRSRFLEYTKAGGEVLPGLVKRRLAEVTWIGDGVSPSSPPASQPLSTSRSTGATEIAVPAIGASLARAPSDAATERNAVSPPERDAVWPSNADDTAAAERASSVAWMLLALDMGAFTPRLEDNRSRQGRDSS